MNLWLDDVRPPEKYGCIGFVWARTAKDAIGFLATGEVSFASLDCDLTIRQTLGDKDGEPTGLDVLLWISDHGVWPSDGIAVHSLNREGAEKMKALVAHHYGRTWPSAVFQPWN